ncbi:hypothetical protein B0H15DRAFT_177744 [Mycena belliarum]|uniref:Uncharacterized protein n=1 Tax=Mycena belliarum TaxID=1033014 RepID=A0AAD6XQC9_9AGAR|nr:hypothetical protein B0H15DRAFT_177744 [Mycena belliae]
MSTWMLLKRGLKSRSNWITFGVILFMYILSATYWVYSIVYATELLHVYVDLRIIFFDADHGQITELAPLFNAIVLVNFVLGDAVVAWRAWVISNRNLRKYLWITIVFVFFTALIVFTTIGFTIIDFVQTTFENAPESNFWQAGIDVLEVSAAISSVASNLAALAVVGATTWRHRRLFRAALKDDCTRIFRLMVESGVFYCFSGIAILIATLIDFEYSAMGWLYYPIHLEIAGSYLPIMLLVSHKWPSTEPSLDASPSELPPSNPPYFVSPHASPTPTLSGPPDALGPSDKITEAANKRKTLMSRFSDDSWV